MNITLLKGMLTVFEQRLNEMQKKVDTVKALKGDKGEQGLTGPVGPKGSDGKTGKTGKAGAKGKDGKDGKDGEDGVGVVSASVDFDKHLVFTLTDGSTIDAGSLEDLYSPEEAAKVMYYTQGGSVDLTQVDTKNEEQDTRLDAVEATQAEQSTKNTEQDGRLDAIESEQSTNTNTNNQQDNRLDAIEAEQTTQNSDINSNTVKNSEQDARLDALEANSTPTLKRTPIESSGVVTRTLDNTFVVDPDRDAYVSYNLRVVATLSVSASPISAALEVSQDGVNFVTVAEAAQASTVSLGGLLSINLLQDYTTQLAGMIPAGSTVRIRTVGQLPPANTITFSNGHETILDIRYQ